MEEFPPGGDVRCQYLGPNKIEPRELRRRLAAQRASDDEDDDDE